MRYSFDRAVQFDRSLPAADLIQNVSLKLVIKAARRASSSVRRVNTRPMGGSDTRVYDRRWCSAPSEKACRIKSLIVSVLVQVRTFRTCVSRQSPNC